MKRKLSFQPIVIEDNVWLGEMVFVMLGVTILEVSIIGANSVVTKDILKYSIVVGNPCKVIKKYNMVTKKWEKIND